jgi:site-specific DNA-cytosine methylase
MFAPIWANDISEQKAAVYEANFGCEHFELGDIKDVNGRDLPFAHLSWASFPCQDLSLAGSLGGIHASRSGLVWEWLRVLDEMELWMFIRKEALAHQIKICPLTGKIQGSYPEDYMGGRNDE